MVVNPAVSFLSWVKYVPFPDELLWPPECELLNTKRGTPPSDDMELFLRGGFNLLLGNLHRDNCPAEIPLGSGADLFKTTEISAMLGPFYGCFRLFIPG